MTPSSKKNLVGVHTQHPPTSPLQRAPKGKKSPQDQVSGESRSSTRFGQVDIPGHLLRVSLLFLFSYIIVSHSPRHSLTFFLSEKRNNLFLKNKTKSTTVCVTNLTKVDFVVSKFHHLVGVNLHVL
jgi:hypothetical protein